MIRRIDLGPIPEGSATGPTPLTAGMPAGKTAIAQVRANDMTNDMTIGVARSTWLHRTEQT